MKTTSTTRNDAPARLTIAVYASFLQGLYLGEIVTQIRQLCMIKGHRLVLIRTGSFGQFRSDLHLAGADAVIIVRNAIAPELAEKLAEMPTPCVSIAYDYFPHKIPVVAADNEHGVRLAFDHLLNQGRRRIAFVGDLSQYDLRKRYEAYCALHEESGLALKDQYLFPVGDTLFSGGNAAAHEFLQRQCDADAVIFGAGLTAVAFVQRLKVLQPQLAESLSFICFDANPLIPVLTPEVVSIDQNLQLLAYRSLNVIEAQLKQEPVSSHTLVQPKIVDTSDKDGPNPFLATCPDLPELENPSYMKGVVANLHDWPREIAASRLGLLMSIAPIFPSFMQSAVLSRYFVDERKNAWVRHTKTYAFDGSHAVNVSDTASLCRAKSFPSKTVEALISSDFDICTHMPIHMNDRLWGVLSLFGRGDDVRRPSSFFGFSGFIEQAVKLFEQELALAKLRQASSPVAKEDSPSAALQPDQEASIRWNIDTGETHWSQEALGLLGFHSAIERNIYQHLEITDRVHSEDLESVRQAAERCRRGREVSFSARVKMKNGEYAQAGLLGKPIVEDQKVVGIHFYIGLQPND